MPKPLVRRARADADVAEAIDYYLAEAPGAAPGFVDALEAAYDHIRRAPATGSPRYAHELNLPGLRFWPCKRYPYLVFYIERERSIEVWRVLHGKRDIPRWLQAEAELSSN
jgi:toxin ParE1/3/4